MLLLLLSSPPRYLRTNKLRCGPEDADELAEELRFYALPLPPEALEDLQPAATFWTQARRGGVGKPPVDNLDY